MWLTLREEEGYAPSIVRPACSLLVLESHQTADEGHDLQARMSITSEHRKNQHMGRLTKRGRTSTISSGTKKMSAFIFLAIEMASLAGSTFDTISPRHLVNAKTCSHHSACGPRNRRSR